MADASKPPPDVLAGIGRALHGDRHWVMRLARDLGVSDDTVSRWLGGRVTLPADHGVFADALALLERRSDELREEADRLRAWMERAR